jgi:colanic acid biosynthesis glycosyl transferase WcaI
MRPRVLIITNVFPPDAAGGAVIFGDLAAGLVERGFGVTVHTAYPYYPQWRDKSGRNGLRIATEEYHGVVVRRFGLHIPKNPGKLPARLRYEASFALSLLRGLFINPAERFDAVIALVPMMGCLAGGAMHKALHRCPLWLIVQDLPADAAADAAISTIGPLQRLIEVAQRVAFNAADLWSSIAPNMVERLGTLTRRGQEVLLLPNWLHRSLADAIAAQGDKAGRPAARPTKLLYSGNVGNKQGLLAFCEFLASAAAPFTFQINADGGQAPALFAWHARARDPRFTLGPFVPEATLARQLHEADLVVVTERPGVRASFLPSKLIPALAAGTPVLAVCDGASPLGREVSASGAGCVVGWDQCAVAGGLIGTLSERTEQLTHWQRAAKVHAARYDRVAMLDRHAEHLRELIARSS